MVASYPQVDSFTQGKQPQLVNLKWFSCDGPVMAIWLRPECVLGRWWASLEIMDDTTISHPRDLAGTLGTILG